MIRNGIILLLFSCFVFHADAQQRDKSFDTYWNRFRKAVIAKNYDSLAALTRFPLIVRGTLDGDPVKKYGKEKLGFIFGHYLKQLNTTVTGNAYDDIAETSTVPAAIFNGTGSIRFSDMEFKKINGKWKLYLIYIETVYQEENNLR